MCAYFSYCVHKITLDKIRLLKYNATSVTFTTLNKNHMGEAGHEVLDLDTDPYANGGHVSQRGYNTSNWGKHHKKGVDDRYVYGGTALTTFSEDENEHSGLFGFLAGHAPKEVAAPKQRESWATKIVRALGIGKKS